MSKNNIPLWQSICEKIKNDIFSNKYQVGNIMPTEFELADIYHVSRITIRAALSKLSDLGLIKRIKGKGTIVLNKRIKEPLLKIKGFSEEMEALGLVPSTSYANIYKQKASGYIAELFNTKISNSFVTLERIRCINDTNVGYFITYFSPTIDLELNSSIYYESLYALLEKKDILIDYIEQSIKAEMADKKTQEMLGLNKSEAIIVMKRKAYMKGVLVEYSVCKYDGKSYEYKMELKKS